MWILKALFLIVLFFKLISLPKRQNITRRSHFKWLFHQAQWAYRWPCEACADNLVTVMTMMKSEMLYRRRSHRFYVDGFKSSLTLTVVGNLLFGCGSVNQISSTASYNTYMKKILTTCDKFWLNYFWLQVSKTSTRAGKYTRIRRTVV